MRLFIAIELPAELKKRLAGLRSTIPGARWVPPEQLHLTLAFLGEVDDATRDLLTTELAKIDVPGFGLQFSGCGCFPDRRRPRVIWVGLTIAPQLAALAVQVSSAVLACGIPQEERLFAPHITLARCRQPVGREVGLFLDQHRQLALPAFSVEEFILFQSRLTTTGASHTPHRRFPLRT